MGGSARYLALFLEKEDTPLDAVAELTWLNGRYEPMSEEEIADVVERCKCSVVCVESPTGSEHLSVGRDLLP